MLPRRIELSCDLSCCFKIQAGQVYTSSQLQCKATDRRSSWNYISSGGKAANCTICHHQGLRLQVFTAVQYAMAMVHAYPFLLNIDHLLDCLASKHNEPSRQELWASAHTVNTAVHCEDLCAYVNGLREDDYPVYVPFPRTPDCAPAIASSQLSNQFLQYSDIF